MNNSDFVIVGDTVKHEKCLICVAGKTEERAKEVLERMLNNPTRNDKRIMDGHSNLRIEEVLAEDCWWRDV